MEIKLKPCPFCGGMPHMYGMKRREYVDGVWAEEEGEEYWVKPFCSITCILGNAHDRAYGILDGLKYTTPEAAAKAWNRRDTTEHMRHYKQGLADAVAKAKGDLMQTFDPD